MENPSMNNASTNQTKDQRDAYWLFRVLPWTYSIDKAVAKLSKYWRSDSGAAQDLLELKEKLLEYSTEKRTPPLLSVIGRVRDLHAFFESWWGASKYMQVVNSGPEVKQPAMDGWNAALEHVSRFLMEFSAPVDVSPPEHPEAVTSNPDTPPVPDVEQTGKRYVLLELSDAKLLASHVPHSVRVFHPVVRMLVEDLHEEAGADMEDIVQQLKKLGFCPACVIEGQQHSCNSLVANKLGRRLHRLVQRAQRS